MNSNSIWPFPLETFNERLSSMRRTIIYNPEDPVSCFVGCLEHYLIHQSVKWSNSALLFTATEDFCPVDIPGSKVSPYTSTGILMLYSHPLSRTWRNSGMLANSGLDTGLFISTDDIIIWLKRFAFPLFGIKIQYSASFFNEIGISWINPGSMKPRANSVFM